MIDGGKYLLTAAKVRKGHVAKKLFFIACSQVDFAGENAATCKYVITLLVVDRRYALLIEGKQDDSTDAFVSVDKNFTSHIFVLKLRSPLRIMSPRKYTTSSS